MNTGALNPLHFIFHTVFHWKYAQPGHDRALVVFSRRSFMPYGPPAGGGSSHNRRSGRENLDPISSRRITGTPIVNHRCFPPIRKGRRPFNPLLQAYR